MGPWKQTDGADSLSLDEQGDLRLHLQVLLGHLAVLLEHSHGLFGVWTRSEGLQTETHTHTHTKVRRL